MDPDTRIHCAFITSRHLQIRYQCDTNARTVMFSLREKGFASVLSSPSSCRILRSRSRSSGSWSRLMSAVWGDLILCNIGRSSKGCEGLCRVLGLCAVPPLAVVSRRCLDWFDLGDMREKYGLESTMQAVWLVDLQYPTYPRNQIYRFRYSCKVNEGPDFALLAGLAFPVPHSPRVPEGSARGQPRAAR